MFKYILEADSNYDGVLDFHEFKSAIKYAQRKLKQNENSDWNSIYNLHIYISKVTVRVKGFFISIFLFLSHICRINLCSFSNKKEASDRKLESKIIHFQLYTACSHVNLIWISISQFFYILFIQIIFLVQLNELPSSVPLFVLQPMLKKLETVSFTF